MTVDPSIILTAHDLAMRADCREDERALGRLVKVIIHPLDEWIESERRRGTEEADILLAMTIAVGGFIGSTIWAQTQGRDASARVLAGAVKEGLSQTIDDVLDQARRDTK